MTDFEKESELGDEISTMAFRRNAYEMYSCVALHGILTGRYRIKEPSHDLAGAIAREADDLAWQMTEKKMARFCKKPPRRR